MSGHFSGGLSPEVSREWAYANSHQTTLIAHWLMRDQHLFLLKRANRIKHNDCLHSANGVTAVTSVRYVFTTTTNPKRLLERPPLITTPLRQSTVIFCYFHFPCDSFEAIYVVSCSLYVIPQFWFDGSTLY